jgi:uncharacterized coiled-coil protein SlyX
METTFNPAKLTTLLPAMELKLDEGLAQVKNLTKASPARTRASDTTEQLKIIGKIVDTISTFVTEMVKTFEKMRASDGVKPVTVKADEATPSKSSAETIPTPPTQPVGKSSDSPSLNELTATIDELFTKLNSITKKIENLSKKVSSLGKKLLKGATSAPGAILKQGVKLLS